MISMHHEDGPSCPLCNQKLTTAHPYFVDWYTAVKAKFPQTHISWAYRNRDMQEIFYRDGKSRVHWPDSPHNAFDKLGAPRARAIDLFVIDADGVGRFPTDFYKLVWKFTLSEKFMLEWGGLWEKFKDAPHFQLSKTIL